MTLRELIESLPEVAEAVAERNDAEATRLLNEATKSVPKPGSRLTELGLLDVLIVAHATAGASDPATTANADLIAVETAAAATGDNSLLSRALRILKDPAGQGLDFGNLATRSMISQLRGGGVLSEVGAVALLAFGSQQVGAARVALGRDVSVDEISAEYAADRIAADNATVLAARTAAWEAANAAYINDPTPETAAVLTRYERELRQTLGGSTVIEGN